MARNYRRRAHNKSRWRPNGPIQPSMLVVNSVYNPRPLQRAQPCRLLQNSLPVVQYSPARSTGRIARCWQCDSPAMPGEMTCYGCKSD